MDGPATAAHAIANFRPRAPWWGGDLQTLRNVLVRQRIDLSPWPEETLRFPMPDRTGDVLTGRLAVPQEPAARPLVVLVHGLTGCEDSIHVRASARALLQAGFPTLRLNLRGAGPTVGLCHEQYHAGRTEDFRAVLGQLPDRLARNGLAAVGYSLGGSMLLKYLGEEGRAAPLCAAAAVSVPIDLAGACGRFHRGRNWLYKRYLLDRMKRDAFRARGGLPERWCEPVRQARTIRDYDAGYIAPRYGFGTVERYYADCSALRFMPAVRVPTLIVHARDDPWIAPEPYERFRWARAPALIPCLHDSGGHVGFHGRGSRATWHDRHILALLRSCAPKAFQDRPGSVGNGLRTAFVNGAKA